MFILKIGLHCIHVGSAVKAVVHTGHCVVPENIHTPTMEGISHGTRPPPGFSISESGKLRAVYTTEKIGTARIKRRTAPTKFDV